MTAPIDRSKFEHSVWCWKSTGRAVLWERFATEAEAKAVVDRLGQVGCSAFVHNGPTDPNTTSGVARESNVELEARG